MNTVDNVYVTLLWISHIFSHLSFKNYLAYFTV